MVVKMTTDAFVPCGTVNGSPCAKAGAVTPRSDATTRTTRLTAVSTSQSTRITAFRTSIRTVLPSSPPRKKARSRAPDRGPQPSHALRSARATDFQLPLIVAFALGLAVRLIHVLQMRTTPLFTVLMGDSRGYDEWARRLAAGDWMGTDVFYQ